MVLVVLLLRNPFRNNITIQRSLKIHTKSSMHSIKRSMANMEMMTTRMKKISTITRKGRSTVSTMMMKMMRKRRRKAVSPSSSRRKRRVRASNNSSMSAVMRNAQVLTKI